MKKRTGILLTCGLLGVATLAGSIAIAQRPGGGGAPGGDNAQADDLVTRMMEFDKDKDGKLTRAEITDERLLRLFDRADANKDGTVTKAELTTLAAAEPAGRRGGPGGPGGGPGGFGGPGGPGGGPGGFRFGEILPQMFQSRLNLSAEQKVEIDTLQKDVDLRLDKILNEEQRAQWKEMKTRGPGGPGGPGGGPGGRRGPGGPGGGPGGPGGGNPPDRRD